MKRAVVFADLLPEPNSTAAGTRMVQLLELLQGLDFELHFLSTSSPGPNSLNLDYMEIKLHLIEINDSKVEPLLKTIDPDLVLFDRFHLEEKFGWRVHSCIPRALTLLDTEDLHFLRKAREESYKKGIELSESELQNDIFLREIASILRSDLTLIISEAEYKLLTEQFKIAPSLLLYLPLFAEANDTVAKFEERTDFLSIGNFLHAPNLETVKILKELWPKIRKVNPKTFLHVYGAYPTPSALGLNNEKQGFLVHGRAENLKEIFSKSRLLLAPIPFGAGIKGKLLDALRFGLPSITSPIGSEGMHQEGKWNGAIVSSPEQFIEKTTLLYNNKESWDEAQKTGFHLLKEKFNKKSFQPLFAKRIISLLSQKDSHRNQNYLRRLLFHHQFNSSKYLSRWIEEKNRKN